MTNEIIASRLAAQFPKIHKHAAGYVHANQTVEISAEEWAKMPVKYTHTDAFCTDEARDCACNSTLVVMTAIHDLEAE